MLLRCGYWAGEDIQMFQLDYGSQLRILVQDDVERSKKFFFLETTKQ